MKKIAAIYIIFLAFNINAQDSNNKKRLINSYTMEYQFGFGGGNNGLMGQANHWWLEKGKFRLQSGVSLSVFYGSERIDAKYSQTSGYNFDTHLQLHTGIEQSLFNKERVYFFFDMYGGVYNIFVKGNYENSELNINKDYKNSTFIWDYGSRFGFGYRIKEKWGIQLSMTNSWRNLYSHGAIGLILGQPDAKFSIGIGMNYRIQ